MTETSTPEADQKAPETPQEPAEGTDAPTDAPEAQPQPPEPQSVDEAAESLGAMVVHHETPAGSLTLRPNQKELDNEQVWALKAIGIDTQQDPGVIPHLRAFVHMCQIRALDPFAREAYLIGRGKGANRKYTMQTGIDGYRKMGAATGRFIRVKKRLWTGADDDDRSYVQVTDEDGDVVRQRVWYDQWPAGRGNPGAAKVVIEHYDEDGNVTTTAAVADWEMYAPYNDVWEGSGQNRHPKRNPDGSVVRELGEMWRKGGPHMLAKCAEALAYRMAFPAKMSGVYITEEMHRLDGEERNRRQREQQDARRAAMERSRGQRPEQAAEEAGDDVVDAELVEEPTPAAEAVTEAVAEMQADGEEAQRLLLAELHWQAEAIGQKPAVLAKRRVQALRKNVEDFTAEELFPVVNGLRGMAAEAAKRAGLDEAEAYAAVAVDGAGPIDVEALGVEDEPIDPVERPHEFEGDDDGLCVECGLAKDVGPHPEES